MMSILQSFLITIRLSWALHKIMIHVDIFLKTVQYNKYQFEILIRHSYQSETATLSFHISV